MKALLQTLNVCFFQAIFSQTIHKGYSQKFSVTEKCLKQINKTEI